MVRRPSALQQPTLYWQQLQQLKASSICIRLYRNELRGYVTIVDIIKAVASSGAIGGWVIWKELAPAWTAIIVASQVVDALKGVFPFAKNHKAASDLTAAMETIYIDAEDDWFLIYSGALSDAEINKRRIKLKKLQLAAERKYFPEGFQLSGKLIKIAETEASAYFRNNDLALAPDDEIALLDDASDAG